MKATRVEGFHTSRAHKLEEKTRIEDEEREDGKRGYEFTMALCNSFFHLSSFLSPLHHFPPPPFFPLFITRFKPRSHPFLLHSLYTHRVNIIYSSGVFRDRPISRQRKLGKEVFPLLKHLFLKLAIEV